MPRCLPLENREDGAVPTFIPLTPSTGPTTPMSSSPALAPALTLVEVPIPHPGCATNPGGALVTLPG